LENATKVAAEVGSGVACRIIRCWRNQARR